ncbi:hypothetical protein FHS70_004304 [Flammeovirga yaeyamensis]|nr:hypothetical protein [Flammeovirga yaeyamensis]
MRRDVLIELVTAFGCKNNNNNVSNYLTKPYNSEIFYRFKKSYNLNFISNS